MLTAHLMWKISKLRFPCQVTLGFVKLTVKSKWDSLYSCVLISPAWVTDNYILLAMSYSSPQK